MTDHQRTATIEIEGGETGPGEAVQKTRCGLVAGDRLGMPAHRLLDVLDEVAALRGRQLAAFNEDFAVGHERLQLGWRDTRRARQRTGRLRCRARRAKDHEKALKQQAPFHDTLNRAAAIRARCLQAMERRATGCRRASPSERRRHR